MRLNKLYTPLIILFSLVVFLRIMIDVATGGWIAQFDLLLNAKIVFIQSPVLTNLVLFITDILSPISLSVFSIIFFGFLIYKKNLRYSNILLFGIVGGLIIRFLLKLAIQRARPENALIEASGYSFPSGHAMIAIIFFSLIIIFLKDYVKNKASRGIFAAIGIVLILLTGFSRLYLNVHWFSDIIAGFSLGAFWLALLFFVPRKK